MVQRSRAVKVDLNRVDRHPPKVVFRVHSGAYASNATSFYLIILSRTRLPPGPALHGLGFYANQYPQSATREPHADFLPDLEGQSIPTLVIKGRCDYLSWSSAQEYLEALPNAQLLYLDGSGHNAYQDEPERYMAGVRAFLLGRPLPERPYEDGRMPEDYQGPP